MTKPRVTFPTCGTMVGYRRHKKTHTTPCDPCCRANNTYMREYRHRTGQHTTHLMTEYEAWHLTGKSGDFL